MSAAQTGGDDADRDPPVAAVLLLASEARRSVLAPWLRVLGEPVRYRLDVCAPRDLAWTGSSWDVIVVDGESLSSDLERERLLRCTSEPPHDLATVVYIGRRSLAERQLEDQVQRWRPPWAFDVVPSGARLGERLRRRVQTVALAPWRRAKALRDEAERRGDRRLRVLSPAPAASARREPHRGAVHGRSRVASVAEGARSTAAGRHGAIPWGLLERAQTLGGQVPGLVTRAFHEGRRIGIVTLGRRADGVCGRFLRQLERTLAGLTPTEPRAEQPLAAALLPAIVSARFGGSRDACAMLRDELRRLEREELAGIERLEVQRAYEP